MYFPFAELNGWGKRFAVRPQTISSGFPKKQRPAIFRTNKGTAACAYNMVFGKRLVHRFANYGNLSFSRKMTDHFPVL